MKVKAVWEFEVDTEDFDRKHVDIKGLAKDLTRREMVYLLQNQEISAEDFSYVIESKQNNKDRISGIIFEYGTNDFGLWEGFVLSEEDENAIWKILSKYDTEGCSIRGTRKEIAEEINDTKEEFWGEETCPYCDHVNDFVCDGTSRKIICKNCGKEILLCSLCDMDKVACGKCPYETLCVS